MIARALRHAVLAWFAILTASMALWALADALLP